MSHFTSFLSSEFIRAFGWALLHSLWQGVALFLVAVVMLMLLRRKSPAVRYAALYLLLALIPLGFMITFLLVFSSGDTSQTASIVKFINQSDQVSAVEAANLFVPAGKATWFQGKLEMLDQNTHWFFLIWFSGFFIFLMKFSGSLLYLHRIRHFRLREAPTEWVRKMKNLSGQIGLDRVVRLAESSLVYVPVTAGYLRPVILVPLGMFTGIPAPMIEAILLHELAHIRRRDYLMNILQSFIEVVFFYQPVTWWLSGLIRKEREHICDDIALTISNDRINYIKALTTMEEKNVKTVNLVPAITGSRKQLLNRVSRLVYPEKARKGLMEGIIACFLLAGLIMGISANALTSGAAESSVAGRIPTAFDLSGGESYEKVTNLLPQSFADQQRVHAGDKTPDEMPLTNSLDPDTIVARSGSGRVAIMVYTDTIKAGDQETLELVVETLEDRIGDYEADKEMIGKEVIILKRNAEQLDSIRKVIVIKEGDSVKVISKGKTIVLPRDSDTTIVTEGGFQFYGYGPQPHAPRIIELPEFKYFEFDDQMNWAEEVPRIQREYEFQWQEAEKQHREMDKQHKQMQREMDEMRVIVAPPDAPEVWHWTEQAPPEPPRSTERIMRQELRDDGLTLRGRKYVVELDGKAMYINGEKQPREVYRKYKKLVESLEPMVLEGEEMYRMIF